MITSKNIMVKAVYYRFYTDQKKDEQLGNYYIQISKDEYNNPYDLEITFEQYSKLLEDGAIKHFATSRTELPKLAENMPAYCYHSITVAMYEFTTNFDLAKNALNHVREQHTIAYKAADNN